MTQQQASPSGPDLTQGVALSDLVNGRLVGHVGDEEVLLVHNGAELFAIGAHCSHYHGPLADGVVTEETVRCPWHHACFDLRSGEAVRAPALSPIDCWKVEQRDGLIFVREKREQPKPQRVATANRARADRHRRRRRGGLCCSRDAAAARLWRQHRHAERRCRCAGRSAEPVEGLSRRQRAGGLAAATTGGFYAENGIELHLNAEVAGIDAEDARSRNRRRQKVRL